VKIKQPRQIFGEVRFEARKFFSKALLLPWVSIIGYYTVCTVIVLFYVSNVNPAIADPRLSRFFSRIPDLYQSWFYLSIFLAINFIINYYLERKSYRYNSLMLVVCALILFFFSIILLPHIIVMFGVI
jgi:amino acid transporter